MHSLLACDIASKCRTYWVGWGKNVRFHFYHMVRSLPHIRHATLLDVLLHFQTYVYVMLPSWTFSCTCTHTSATHVLSHFHTYVMLRCWMFFCTSKHTSTSCYPPGRSLALAHIRQLRMFSRTSTHTSCYAAGRSLALPHTSTSCHAAGRSLALPHIRHATLLDVLSLLQFHTHTRLRHARLLDVLVPFHTYVMLRCWTFCHCCTSTHTSTSCYAAGRSLALPHIRHGTVLDFLLHFHTYAMLPCWTFSCTSTHTSTSCNAAGRSLALPHIRLRHAHAAGRSLALPHIRVRHATLLDVLLHFHTYVYVMPRCWTFSCTSTHTSWYAAGRSVTAIPHTRQEWIIIVIRQELNPVTCKLQVRRDDQSRYHNLKPPSSLGSGWNEIHCPPALVHWYYD